MIWPIASAVIFRGCGKEGCSEMTDQGGTPDAAPAEVRESLLVDLSELTLADVAELPDTVLGAALRAIMEAARNPDAVFTAEHQEKLSRS